MAAIDGGNQIRRLLARVAADSTEDDWPSDLGAIIGQARVDLAQSGIVYDLSEAAHWPTSNRHVHEILLGHLNNHAGLWTVQHADTLARLDPEPDDRRRAIDALLGGERFHGAEIANALTLLDPAPDDKHKAREAWLRLLADSDNWIAADQAADGLVQLGARPSKRERGNG